MCDIGGRLSSQGNIPLTAYDLSLSSSSAVLHELPAGVSLTEGVR